MMNWEKQGLIYCPDGSFWWTKRSAMVPTIFIMEDRIRVFYTSLDENNYGRIGYVDLAKDDPKQILYVAPEPILGLGELGTFDDCGVVPSDVVVHDGKIYLYYIGFQRAERVPYMLFSGLAISEDGQTFKRYSTVPILDRTHEEPFSRSAPYILKDENGFKMWYWSCSNWTTSGDKPHYNNVIRYATSSDAIHWTSSPHICLKPSWPDEYALGRPVVMKSNDIYHMWYSIRSHSKPYYMGYAVSQDGIHWQRNDNQAGIKTSSEGWDSQMVCYPYVVNVEGKQIMFYNGNQHGCSGFGYAVRSNL